MKSSVKRNAKHLLCIVLALMTMLSVVSNAFAADKGMNASSGDSFSFMIGGDGSNGAKVVCNYCQGIRATLLDAVTGVAVPSKRGGNTSFDIAGAHAYNGSGEGMMGFMGNGISTSLSKYDYLYGDYADLGITETSDMKVRFQQWRDLFNNNIDEFPHLRDQWDSVGYETNNQNGTLASWTPSGKITTNSQFTNSFGPDGGWTDGQTGNTTIQGSNNKAAMPVVINDAAGAKRVNINAVKNYFTAKYAEDGSIFEDPEKDDPVIFILAQYWALVGTGNESKLDNYKEFISGKYDLLIEPLTDYYNAWKGGYMILTATDIAVMGFYEDAKSTSTTEFMYNIPNSAILEYEEEYSSAVYSTCETNDIISGDENGGWHMYAPSNIFYNMGMWIVHFAGDVKDNVKVLCFDKSKAIPGDDKTGLLAHGVVKMEGGTQKPLDSKAYLNNMYTYFLAKYMDIDAKTKFTMDTTTKDLLCNGKKVESETLAGSVAAAQNAREKAYSDMLAKKDNYMVFAKIPLESVRTLKNLKLEDGIKEGLEGYTFEFALGEDAISKVENGVEIVATDESYEVEMVSVHGESHPVIRLYYGEGNKYKVRVRINGDIDPTRDQEFPAPTGDIIEEKDVDKSKVPEDATITDIENVPLTIDPDPEKNIIIIDCIVPGYTVKVRVNGEIIPDLTRFYPAKVGDVIKKEDVDTSIVPPELTIVGIENVPLTIDPDSEKNVIIIDCKSDTVFYTIEYYLDGVFAESEMVPATKGDVITNPVIKGFPGYKLDKIVGTPLTIMDSKGVIKVYYSKVVQPAAASPVAKIFADEYITAIPNASRPTEKSGYGVYSLYYIDMSSYLNAYENPRWSVPAGCGPQQMSKTVPKYQKTSSQAQIDYQDAVVTASWIEGTKIVGGKAQRDENGHRVTVQMEYDAAHSTSTVWAFRLPANPASSKNYHKAYIPTNTPDGQNKWGISYTFTLNCNVYSWDTTAYQTSCAGHLCGGAYPDGKGGYVAVYWYEYHRYTCYSLNEHWTPYTIKNSAEAYLSIKGNMYEDDFTGDRKGK